jgi:hypothetical protein
VGFPDDVVAVVALEVVEDHGQVSVGEVVDVALAVSRSPVTCPCGGRGPSPLRPRVLQTLPCRYDNTWHGRNPSCPPAS